MNSEPYMKIDIMYYKQLYVYLHDNPDAKKGKPNGSLPNASECVIPTMKASSFILVKLLISEE